jgi:hypothetical protein
VTVNGDGLIQLGSVDAKTSAAISAGNQVTALNPVATGNDGSIDIASLIARGGAASLTAFSNDASPAPAAYDGDILLGSGTATVALTLSNSAGTNGAITVSGALSAASVTADAADTATLAAASPPAPVRILSPAAICPGQHEWRGGPVASGAVSLTPGAGGILLAGDLTLASTAGGAVSLNGPVDGGHALTVNTSGVTRLGNVGANTALSSLNTDAGGQRS